MSFTTPSRTSPETSRRGCLCKNGKYNKKCCNGSLHAQGIGGEGTTFGLLRENGAMLYMENGFKIIL